MEHVVHGVALGIHRDLGDQADAAVFGDDHIALIGLQLPCQYLEKGGFPRAVPA